MSDQRDGRQKGADTKQVRATTPPAASASSAGVRTSRLPYTGRLVAFCWSAMSRTTFGGPGRRRPGAALIGGPSAAHDSAPCPPCDPPLPNGHTTRLHLAGRAGGGGKQRPK